jgi:hypothetical protein
MLKWLVAVAVAAAILLVGREVLRGPRSVFAGFKREMQARYERVQIGTSKTEVLAALGQPKRVEPTFCLPQELGFEKLFEAAKRSGSTEYHLWTNGCNWYYCIGFDRDGRVSMKGEGNS